MKLLGWERGGNYALKLEGARSHSFATGVCCGNSPTATGGPGADEAAVGIEASPTGVERFWGPFKGACGDWVLGWISGGVAVGGWVFDAVGVDGGSTPAVPWTEGDDVLSLIFKGDRKEMRGGGELDKNLGAEREQRKTAAYHVWFRLEQEDGRPVLVRVVGAQSRRLGRGLDRK